MHFHVGKTPVTSPTMMALLAVGSPHQYHHWVPDLALLHDDDDDVMAYYHTNAYKQ